MFSGLKPGSYTFEYHVGKSFFEQSGESWIGDGDVGVVVSMERGERMLDLHFSIHGSVKVPCDRCNEPVEVKVDGEERLIVKYGDRYHEESEDVQVIPESANLFDVGPFIYEYIHLLVPARRVHPADADGNSLCDPAVLKKLEELSGQSVADPRWEALNVLKNKNRKS
jgi:uncharacterized metal-binding protein YceD (DUF177 family)